MIEKIKNYLLESLDEVRTKVSWPKFSELQGSAILVLVASLIFALLIWVVDISFQSALNLFYESY
jgi:preprotein translocase subunit SecE